MRNKRDCVGLITSKERIEIKRNILKLILKIRDKRKLKNFIWMNVSIINKKLFGTFIILQHKN